MNKTYYTSKDKNFSLLSGDVLDLLPQLDIKFDMIFADPPYFLSNDGLTIENGKIASVNKGSWDKATSYNYINDFNYRWLSIIKDKMKNDATIWISGTDHNIFNVGNVLNLLDFKILNIITWQKTNPPPNFSCRYFTHSTEQIIWARKSKNIPHFFNYDFMKRINNDKQMTDVWSLSSIAKWEKSQGKHPTQKPLSLLARIILASTKKGSLILDPFAGSSTTGIAANLCNRRFYGIDFEEKYLEMSKNRKIEIENLNVLNDYRSKIDGFLDKNQLINYLSSEE